MGGTLPLEHSRVLELARSYRPPLDAEDRQLDAGGPIIYLEADRSQRRLTGLLSSVATAVALGNLNRGTKRAVMVANDPRSGGGLF